MSFKDAKYWKQRAETAERIVANDAVLENKLKADIKKLVTALEHLVDVQNGPPLLTYADDWKAAVREAEDLLEEHKDG